MIDLRTDTITVPSQAMRAAMAAAEVGDDFYREDPTVQTLEVRMAAMLGKEAGLYVPSGTMGNLLAHLVHGSAGGEVVGPEPAHSFTSEGGGPSRVAGVTTRTWAQRRGELDLERIASLIHGASLLAQGTGLLWIEQPTRGYLVELGDLAALRALADDRGLPIHYDGARIFNAAVALGLPAHVVAEHADTVMVCVSKGLAAPVGSLLIGPADFIEHARLRRQMLGGGMRQAGIVAAAGLYALENNIDRLADDHANAARLAEGLAAIPGLRLDRDLVETNIFYVEVVRPGLSVQDFAAGLRERGILVNSPPAGRRTVRFVTHYGIDRGDIEAAIVAAADMMAHTGAVAGPAAAL